MTPRIPFSLCMPFHNNPRMLATHYSVLATLPDDIKRGLEVVICDDASNDDERAFYPTVDVGVQISIFRIPPPHIAWSHRCATNIAAAESRGNWLLITDIDHIVPLQTWSYLMDGQRPRLRTDRAYMFARRNMSDDSEYKPHPDSWLFHRSLWHQIAGYDERYRGHYGQNYAFIQRVQHRAVIEGLPCPLLRVSRDDIHDASERLLTRKSEEAKAAIAALRRKFVADGSFYADTRLSAKYERVKP